MTTRYVDVAFGGGRSAMARALYQYDYGQILRITDLDLPVAYEVHFAEGKTGNSVTQIGNADGVDIPDAMLLKSGSFYAWFYLHETSSDGETRYEILFPVMQRAKPTNATPTPVQQDTITEAIAALNAAVEQTGADVEAAAASASAAADSESNSEAWAVGERDGVPVEPSDPTYHNNSAYYASVAESASQGGEGFALKAEGFAVGEQDGVPVESGSPYYHNNAEYYKNQSSGYSSNASAKASAAAASALVSEGYAVGTQDGTPVSSDSPYYHGNALYYATSAGASAYNASVSETNAGNSATDAGNAKTAAQNAQGLAEAAKTAADADALKAEGFAVGEQNGSAVASGSPYYHNNASYYATQAGNSATSASGSASSAGADALVAEGWARGTQNGTPVASGTYFEDNSKYYAEQAEDSATSAESAQTAAETARDAAIAATEDKAPVILDSASGAIVSIVDGAQGMNARSLVASMSPIQDLHGYSNPWPAGGGKNIVNESTGEWTSVYGGISSSFQSGVWTIINSSAAQTRSANMPVGTLSAGTYYLSATAGTMIVRVNLKRTLDDITIGYFQIGDANPTAITISEDTDCYLNVTTTQGNNSITHLMLSSENATYSPYSNICPISGRTGLTAYRTGVNVWDEEWEIGGFNYTTGEPLDSATDRIRSKYFCGCRPSTQYYWRIPYKNLRILYYDVNQNFIGYGDGWKDSPYVITTPNNAVFFKIAGSAAYGTTYNNDIAVNYPATDTDYHAYTGTSYPVSWQTEAGTVYGGTVDIVSGVLTVTHAMFTSTTDDGITGQARSNNGWAFTINSASEIYKSGKVLSNINTVVPYYSQTQSGYCNAITPIYKPVFYLNDSDTGLNASSTSAEIKTAYDAFVTANSPYAVYPLRNPTTYQLAPTQVQMLLGANNVWSTGDTVDLTYPCDTRLYIERLTAPTEDDMVANANIPIHQYFMIGNSLYYSTQAIAQGAAIVVGTNCNRVGLADALNALA